MNQGFKQRERLKSRKLIQNLFKEGKPLKAYPLLAISLPDVTLDGLKVGFSVSKKRLRLAVSRNTVKRRILEAYRLNRNNFDLQKSGGGAVMFIYLQNGIASFESIESSMKKILSMLSEIESSNTDNQP